MVGQKAPLVPLSHSVYCVPLIAQLFFLNPQPTRHPPPTQRNRHPPTKFLLVHTRALISGSASVARRSATRLRRVLRAARKPPAGAPGGSPGRAPGGPPERKKMQNMREYAPENQVNKLRLNASRTSTRRVSRWMPWDVLEQKRADHTYTPEVRSSSGPASLNQGQSIKKRETSCYYIRHLT